MTGKEMIEIGIVLIGGSVLAQLLITPFFRMMKKHIIKKISEDAE